MEQSFKHLADAVRLPEGSRGGHPPPLAHPPKQNAAD